MKRIVVVAMCVAAMVSPARADTVYSAPYRQSFPTSGCDGGSPALTACRYSANGDAATGRLTVSTSLLSPKDGTLPWYGGGLAIAGVEVKQSIGEGHVRIPLSATFRIHDASAVHTGVLYPALIGESWAQIHLYACHDQVELCYSGVSQVIARPGRPLFAGEQEITLAYEYQPWGSTGEPLPAGTLWIYAEVQAQSTLGRADEVPGAGRVVAAIDATVVRIVVGA